MGLYVGKMEVSGDLDDESFQWNGGNQGLTGMSLGEVGDEKVQITRIGNSRICLAAKENRDIESRQKGT